MYHFAIIDDDKNDMDSVLKYLDMAKVDFSFDLNVSMFNSPFDFLESKAKNSFDVIFLDIDMPGMKGIDMAKKFRENNSDAIIIFVTRMAQYALEGYSVQALDFIVKPITYSLFKIKMPRILDAIKRHNGNEQILINDSGSIIKVSVDDIYYVEVIRNDCIFTTKNGERKERKTISKLEEELKVKGFARPNNSFLVNLRYVEKITGTSITIHNHELPLSRTFKNSFMESFNDYLGEGGL